MYIKALWENQGNSTLVSPCGVHGPAAADLLHMHSWYLPHTQEECKSPPSPRRNLLFYFIFLFLFYFFYLSWILSHIEMKQPRVYMCSPSQSPSHLPLHPLPLGFPSAPGPSACLMHPTWAGDLFHPRQYTCFNAVLLKHPTLAFSHRVQKTVL